MTDSEREKTVIGAINAKGGNIRGLARELAGEAAGQKEIERWRRMLNRLRKGAAVKPWHAERIAPVLGLSESAIVETERRRSTGSSGDDFAHEIAALNGRLAHLEDDQSRLADELAELRAALSGRKPPRAEPGRG